MSNTEEIKEKLALHGYKDWQDCSIEHQGQTFYAYKNGNRNRKERIVLKFHQEVQVGDQFWVFEIGKYIKLFDENSMTASMFVEIQTIREDQLKYLPVFETRLNAINTDPIE